MNYQNTMTAIPINNTTTTGVVTRKTIKYLKHVLIGAIIAVCTFTATLAAQPSIASEPEYVGVAYMVANASEEDVEFFIANHMDANILQEIEVEIEDMEVPLSAGEYIMSYVVKDDSIIEHLENYFIGE